MTQSLQEKVETRFRSLREAKFVTFHCVARSLFRFLDSKSAFIAIAKQLSSESPNARDRLKSYLNNSGEGAVNESESAAAALGEQFLRLVAEEGQPPRQLYDNVYSRQLGAPDSSPLHEREERMMSSVKAQFLEPFYLYVIEHLNQDEEIGEYPVKIVGASDMKEKFAFITDPRLAIILSRDYNELQTLDPYNSTKSVIVLSGGIMEGLLIDALVLSGTLTFSEACNNELKKIINKALEKGIITEDRLSHAIRNYRNLVHPGREIKDNVIFSVSDATIAKAAVDIFIREVKSWSSTKKSEMAIEVPLESISDDQR